MRHGRSEILVIFRDLGIYLFVGASLTAFDRQKQKVSKEFKYIDISKS